MGWDLKGGEKDLEFFQKFEVLGVTLDVGEGLDRGRAVVDNSEKRKQRNVDLQHLVAEFKKSKGIDLTNDKLAVQRLREAAETAKIELASKSQADIKVPFITPFQTGPKHLQVSLSRAQPEKLVDPLLMKTKGPCEACTKDVGLENDEINEILLVGGMTRMPIVTEVGHSVFGRIPPNSVNPDEAVAMGAAI